MGRSSKDSLDRSIAPTYARRARLIGTCLALVAACSITLSATAQTEAPEFDVDVMSVLPSAGAETVQLDIYTRIPVGKLRFIATPEGFTARYQVSADLVELDTNGRRVNVVESPIWDRTVRVPNYADTQNPERYDFTTHAVTVAPGAYLLEIQIEDRSSAETFVHAMPVVAKSLSSDVALSDVLLLDEFDGETNTIFPNVAERVASDEFGFTLFYELYSREAPVDVSVRRLVVHSAGGAPALRRGVDADNADVVFAEDQLVTLDSRRSQHVVNIPLDELSVGTYQISVDILDDNGQVLDMARTMVRVEWSGLQEHIRNLDEAISQLAYIAKPRDIRHIKQAESESGRINRFMDFWERRDPTPGTSRNEKMEEYYYRVAFANRQYTSLTDGWRTDRGQVIVLFGEPDFVERHPYNFSVKPYEVWYYYRNGRRFIFIDETGLGDYRLLKPVWDETTRLR